MRKQEWKQFTNWLKDKGLWKSDLTVAVTAVYLSHWKDGVASGIY